MEHPLAGNGGWNHKTGEGWQPVSWDEALEALGDRLRAVIDEHGPQAVGVYFGSGQQIGSTFPCDP